MTIRLDGTVVGTASNSLGEFIMTVPQDTGRLIFTFVGFKQKRVAFKAGQRLVVILEEEVEDLDEVVVTGYQVINRKKLTSAITSVKMEDIMIPGATSIDQMLEGRIQDLMLTTNSGEVGV
ncbi:MAG: carboxypeptidase-like regulatory domain-containing protein, partial [Butyricimonas faecihominis]